jgi:hypothetical protein
MSNRKGYLKQIHPVLLVKNLVNVVDYYVNKLGFKFAFFDLHGNGLTFYKDY